MTADLRAQAQAVLRANDAGGWTKPSPAQYPHQWNWDSGFIAIGLSTFDWPRACIELESLLRGQWRDGMLPHVRYDSRHLVDYFPGPDWWPGAQSCVRIDGELTSGISNPPIAVLAASIVADRAPDRERRRAFLARVVPRIRDFVAWWRDSRTLPGSPLPVMVHPWESGWDNSPRWDFLASAGLKPSRPYRRLDTVHVGAAQRPTGKDYDSFLALAELLDACEYDVARYRERSPFCVHDVVVDALWYRAASEVNRLAGEVGERPPFESSELDEFAAAFESIHWDEDARAYVDYDLVGGRRLAANTAAGVASLSGAVAERERAAASWHVFKSAADGLTPVPTALEGHWFEPDRYWRGPAWINVDWLVVDGLERAGLEEEARSLAATILALVKAGGLYEYFGGRTAAGLGAADFSWTAALTLDLLQRKGKPVG